MPSASSIKTCCTCREDLPLDAFGRDKSRASGLSPRCKACCSVNGKGHYRRNRAKVLEQHRAWKEANAERVREADRAWRRANAEKSRAYSRRWQKANPEAYKASRRRWNEANREKHREEVARRRALAKAVPVAVEYVRDLLDRPCAYCGSTEHIEIDHIVPLSRGGTHEPENLAPACRSCNRSKGAKLLSEWKALCPRS